MSNIHNHQIRIYIEDTDAGGIVYYANYFRFFERARTEWIRTFGYGKDFIHTYGLMFVVRSIDATFHRPAVLDDLVIVQTRVTQSAKTYIDLAQNVIRCDNAQLLVEAKVRIALITCNNQRPARIPQELHNAIKETGNL